MTTTKMIIKYPQERLQKAQERVKKLTDGIDALIEDLTTDGNYDTDTRSSDEIVNKVIEQLSEIKKWNLNLMHGIKKQKRDINESHYN